MHCFSFPNVINANILKHNLICHLDQECCNILEVSHPGAGLIVLLSVELDMNLGPLISQVESQQLQLSYHLWAPHLGVRVLTILCLLLSIPSLLLYRNFSASLQVDLISSFSANGCNFGVPMGGSELRVFLSCGVCHFLLCVCLYARPTLL